MPTPLPHQIAGAQFLASRRAAFLADDPRVGKTGASIMACDLAMAERVLVVTTATGRANFGREFSEWQALPRKVQVIFKPGETIQPDASVLVVGWSVIGNPQLLGRLHAWGADVLVLDEAHYAKSRWSIRGDAAWSLAAEVPHVMCLSGTPMPNAPDDLWPVLSTLAPDRISHMSYEDFVDRYCVTNVRYVNGRAITVVKGGKNLGELKDRLDGFFLRRTQSDVGIREPVYALLSLVADAKRIDKMILAELSAKERILLNAVLAGEANLDPDDEIQVSSLMRATGKVKAPAVADLVAEELDDGLMDQVVLMAWHTGVIGTLRERLAKYGVVGIDGRTPPQQRQGEVDRFQRGDARVFVGQMVAAGEGIDLSASCNLIFVEGSFVPKNMRQAALRITNLEQKRQCLVRFAALAGSIDEAVMAVLKRKVFAIKRVINE